MGTAGQTIRLYLHIWKRYWRSWLALFVLVIIGVLTSDMLTPYYISKVIETLGSTSPTRATQAMSAFWMLTAVSVLGMVCWRTIGFWIARRQPWLIHEFEQFVFERLMCHSYGFFSGSFSGSLIAQTKRFVQSAERLEDLYHWQILRTLVQAIATLVVLLVALPSVGVLMLGWTVIYTTSVLLMVRRAQRLVVQASGTDTLVTRHLSDAITNVMNIISFGKRRTETESFRKVSDYRRRINQRTWTTMEFIWSYADIMSVVVRVTTLWLSIRAVMHGGASVAVVLAAQFYVLRLSANLSELPGIISQVSRLLGDATEMTQVLNLQPEIQDVVDPKPLAVTRSAVRFENVRFSYNGSRPVFDDFTLAFKPGERIGLVGHSGSGKSTLVKLLLRFADVQNGRITIDGQDIRQVAQDDLRAHIAYVSQEPVLFHRSLAENIRYGRPVATDEEVRTVARLAHAAEFIESLPDSYDTLVGERGIKLSGGEKQRVAIARAMLSEAPILVLDEATSSLDSESEQLITDALKKLMAKRTTLVIAHRLSTIRALDRIVVLDHGQIVEQGSHRSLLRKRGAYAELWKHQTGGFLDE